MEIFIIFSAKILAAPLLLLKITSVNKQQGYLAGKMLIAAPSMGDPRFAQTLLYMCAHDEHHAMGIIINQPMHILRFPTLLKQLGIDTENTTPPDMPVLSGGPVDPERGFVLHSLEYNKPEETTPVTDNIGLSASKEILLAMASDDPPKQCLLALGLSSWIAGQIEFELEQNAWLVCEADDELLFDQEFASKWNRAMFKIGVDPDRFSHTTGHA
ncbi:YqgE/AlgH family protein [Oceanicaulis sp. AH-315-P02]|nr:YqgE/AlgH family protein [Oceanicaulis sp. AH-315-P02]